MYSVIFSCWCWICKDEKLPSKVWNRYCICLL